MINDFAFVWLISSPFAILSAYFFGRVHGLRACSVRYEKLVREFASKIVAMTPTAPVPKPHP
jgi:hypothetical protein